MRRRGATEGIDQWRWCSGPYYPCRRMAVGLDGNCLVITGVLDGRRDVAEEGKVSICDEDMPTSSRRTVVEYIAVDFHQLSNSDW
ncbi:hypothetical protein L1887_36689 [Cichorium endivia]|nr:hypothetical protein L1887_36689 [Cichorium endivia]